MAQKFNIQKIGNSTVVKSFDDARPNVVSTKNYNQNFDIDLQPDGKFIVSKNEKPVLSFLFSQIDNPGDAETAEEYRELMTSNFFFSRVASGGGGSGEPIKVEGNPFVWIKNPINSSNEIQKGDMAVNGWRNSGTFVKLMMFNSGDPTLFDSWIILDQIEEIETE